MSFVSFVSYPPSLEIVKIVKNWGTPPLTKLTKLDYGVRMQVFCLINQILRLKQYAKLSDPSCRALGKRHQNFIDVIIFIKKLT